MPPSCPHHVPPFWVPPNYSFRNSDSLWNNRLKTSDDGRVPVFLLKGPHPVPKLLGDPSEASSSGLCHNVLSQDDRSLLTGKKCSTLQCCHICSACRWNSNDPEKERKQEFKNHLENYYTRLGFNGDGTFQLDSEENCIVLESSYHTMWDKYGLFCFMPTASCIVQWAQVLYQDNKEWEKNQSAKPNEEVQRPSNAYDRMLKDIKEIGLEVAVIDSANFSPEGSPHVFRVDGEYRIYTPHSSQLRRYNGETAPRMRVRRNISPFALILNAYSKLKDRDFNDPLLELQYSLLEELMKCIFWMPRNHLSRKDQLRFQPPPSPAYHPSSPRDADSNPDDSDSPGRNSHEPMDEDDSGFRSDVTERCHEGDTTERDSQHLRNKTAVQDDDEFSALDLLPNGLTPKEMDIVERKSCDPDVNPSERVDAGLMLVGMACGYPKPILSCVF
ncbi:hypothetical protein Moror_880 [Moniliophthora roreri MCA 2997]|uniref:Uncharacterized protein n=2 Tax=Moniliophthora roreri TaxID=221103 RepID=V2X7V5_MONRO|nr:hypothetical protein Moror_880 [Moniliophthora roreri MCA 2997]KAI3606331.1 hypothetical protein WG66_009517 [Moniliophthora roreri]